MTVFSDSTTYMQRVKATVVTLCVVILFMQSAVAQDTVRNSSVHSVVVGANDTIPTKVHKNAASKALRRSTGIVAPNPVVEKHTPETVSSKDTMPAVSQHSPTKAMWMSAALPGLGQVYNKQAWKIPIIYAGAAGVTYFAITNYQGKEKFRKEYINRQNGNTDALLERYVNYPDANIYSIYQSYNRNFQLSIIVGGLFYVLNIIDAYVYGHLFDFEINDDLSLVLRPNVDFFSYGEGFSTCATGLTLHVRF